jgi:uncharacterized coiled-coil DUF342 family protein
MRSKEDFITTLHAKIDEWDAEIEKLSIKAAELEEESRQECYAQIAELKSKRYELEEKLETLQKTGDAALQDLKSGLDLAIETMSEALRSATSRFK